MPIDIGVHVQPYVDRFQEQSTQGKIAIVAGGVGALVLVGNLFFRRSDGTRPGTGNLSGGGIERGKVKSEFDQYSASYGKNAGDGITDRTKTTELVDTFYNLVTGKSATPLPSAETTLHPVQLPDTPFFSQTSTSGVGDRASTSPPSCLARHGQCQRGLMRLAWLPS